MRHFAIALVIVGCSKDHSGRCKASIEHVQSLDHKDAEHMQAAIDQCAKDRWPDVALDCFDAATTPAAAQKCIRLISPEAAASDDSHKAVDAKLRVQNFALVGFPKWATAHPDKKCPEKLTDLQKDTGDEPTIDPWGTPLKMDCTDGKLTVTSTGPDGKVDTPDDISAKL